MAWWRLNGALRHLVSSPILAHELRASPQCMGSLSAYFASIEFPSKGMSGDNCWGVTSNASMDSWNHELWSKKGMSSESRPPGSLLGVVENISDVTPGFSPKPPHKAAQFKVVEFLENGTVSECTKTAKDLRLQPRDVSLFTLEGRFAKQRATIAARDGAILFRTEMCRAIIFPHKAILFPLRRKSDTIRLSESLLSRIEHDSSFPFELRVLEGLLDGTADYFARRGRRIRLLLESIISDLESQKTSDVDAADFQRLLPIRKSMTEMQYDTKEARVAIAEAAENEKLLSAICLTEQLHSSSSPKAVDGAKGTNMTRNMRLAAALLDSYERQVATVEGDLKEMEENMDDAREVWHMQMDSVRNRIIRINLVMSIASFSMLIASIPAAFFGMNIVNGWEESTVMFPAVVGGCLGGGAASYLSFYAYYRYWPARRHQHRLREMKALRDILIHHMDDIDELLSKLRLRSEIRRDDFQIVVKETCTDPPISDREVDLLYRVFDTNRDGFLESGELLKTQGKVL